MFILLYCFYINNCVLNTHKYIASYDFSHLLVYLRVTGG